MYAALRPLLASLIVAHVLAASAEGLDGVWQLSVEDQSHKEVTSLVIRFTSEERRGCADGDWRQIVVESSKTADPEFFPVSQSLSYNLSGTTLTIGYNGICDYYLELSGTLENGWVRGKYRALGLGWEKDGGFFTLHRSP